MRPALAVAVVVLLLGSVALYLSFAASVPPRDFQRIETWAKGEFAVEVTLSFDAVGDAFSFEETSPTLVVHFRGRELLRRTDTVPAGVPIRIEPVPDVVEENQAAGEEGNNDFGFAAVGKLPSAAGDGFSLDGHVANQLLSRALRVRIFRDGDVVADRTIWSRPGEPVEGNVVLKVTPLSSTVEHVH